MGLRFNKGHLLALIFIIISVLIHFLLIQIFLTNQLSKFANNQPSRLTLILYDANTADILKRLPPTKTDSDNIKRSLIKPEKKIDHSAAEVKSANGNSPKKSSVWGMGSTYSKQTSQASPEEDQLKSRLAQQAMQKHQVLSKNIAQMLGRLSMMQPEISCALRLNKEYNQASLECLPSHYEGLIKQSLATSYLRWSEADDSLDQCIPIVSRTNAEPCK